MKLRAVQVLKLEEYKKKDYTHMDSFGFSKVAGGFHTEQVFTNDVVMNDDDEIGADMDGDF